MRSGCRKLSLWLLSPGRSDGRSAQMVKQACARSAGWRAEERPQRRTQGSGHRHEVLTLARKFEPAIQSSRPASSNPRSSPHAALANGGLPPPKMAQPPITSRHVLQKAEEARAGTVGLDGRRLGQWRTERNRPRRRHGRTQRGLSRSRPRRPTTPIANAVGTPSPSATAAAPAADGRCSITRAGRGSARSCAPCTTCIAPPPPPLATEEPQLQRRRALQLQLSVRSGRPNRGGPSAHADAGHRSPGSCSASAVGSSRFGQVRCLCAAVAIVSARRDAISRARLQSGDDACQRPDRVARSGCRAAAVTEFRHVGADCERR